MGTLDFDAMSFRTFAASLRTAAPILNREFKRSMKAAGAIVANDIKANLPHQAHAPTAKQGVTVDILPFGVAVSIGGATEPKSYAYAFTVGNKGTGQLWHPTFGHRYNARTMPSHPEVIVNAWLRGGTAAMLAADAAIDATMQALSWEGAH